MTASTKTQRQRSRFSYVTESGTVLAIVFTYLNGKFPQCVSQREGRQRAMDALLAFWKPYALRAQQASSDKIREAAQASVMALFRQMQTLGDDFGIELPLSQPSAVHWEGLLTALVTHLEKPVGMQTPITTIAPTPTNGTGAIEQHQAMDELIFVDDEDLLGDLD